MHTSVLDKNCLTLLELTKRQFLRETCSTFYANYIRIRHFIRVRKMLGIVQFLSAFYRTKVVFQLNAAYEICKLHTADSGNFSASTCSRQSAAYKFHRCIKYNKTKTNNTVQKANRGKLTKEVYSFTKTLFQSLHLV